METPETYLRNADSLLRGPVHGAGGVWPRACAWLLRLAFESALDAYWQRDTERWAVGKCPSRRAQLIALNKFAGRDVAGQAAYAWWALSRLNHHHGYELAPTATELAHLREVVNDLMRALSPS